MAKPGSPLCNISTNRKFKVKKPTFKVNDKIGNLTVIEYKGRLFIEGATTAEHTYLTICTCGEIRTVGQGFLISNRSIYKCKSCVKKHNKENGKRIRQEILKKKSSTTLTLQDVTSLKW